MPKYVPDYEGIRLLVLESFTNANEEPEQVYNDLTKLAARVLDTPFATISFVGSDGIWFKSCYGCTIERFEKEHSLFAQTLRYPEDGMVVCDMLHKPVNGMLVEVVENETIRSYAGVPLMTPDGFGIGVISVMDTNPRCYTSDEIEYLKILARQTITLLEHGRERDRLTKENDKLSTLSRCDSLTGLHNVRAFHERLDDEILFCFRSGTSLSLLLLDADHFKSYNDEFGHPAGDLVLQALSIFLLDSSREYDFVARYGGEEFAIILRGADSSEAFKVAERLREKIADAAWPERLVTASIGVATFSKTINSSEKLIAEADRQLYRSKTMGRNRVSVSDNDVQLAIPDWGDMEPSKSKSKVRERLSRVSK